MGAMERIDSAEFAQLLGIELLESSPERVVCAMPVAGKRQPFGIMHGGANAVLVEHAGSLLGLELCPEGRIPVGTRVHAEHLRPVREGAVQAEARVLALSGAGATIGVDIRDDAGARTATGELTLVFLSRESLERSGRKKNGQEA